MVPVLLLTGLVVLQGLFGPLGWDGGAVRGLVGWLGIDVGSVWPVWDALDAQLGGVLRLSPTSLVTVVEWGVDGGSLPGLDRGL